ncbi:MAG: c-type cytochrome [Myxococcales bacterium]|nr:c-type cytochrome [Myxococcales bacterium]
MSGRATSVITVATLALLAGCTKPSARDAGAAPSPGSAAPAPSAKHAEAPRAPSAPTFTPPPQSAIPGGPFGDAVRQGRAIFTDTPTYARAYVGNVLSCNNCHLDAGRLPSSAPLWGAWGMYPKYRKKNGHVNTFAERLQGCFRYSMNGTAPPLGSPELVALQAYARWMSEGAPVGVKLAGAGYPREDFRPPEPPDYARGEAVFKAKCALCHGADGQGQQAGGRYVFPPLWGPRSFNWGAGMHELHKAAAFIKANMPFSRGGTLSDQEAWDVALFMDSHERPQDPRFTGDVAETRAKYHDTPMSLYGTEVHGHVLGSPSAE